MAEQESQFAPEVCGSCPHLFEEDTGTHMGMITLYRCSHGKGPFYVMPSHLSEDCPLEKEEKPQESDLLPSPRERMHLSEEAIFMIEALRWYASENCTEQEQTTIENYLQRIWTEGQFTLYLSAIMSMREPRIFQTIYQSILGYQDTTRKASSLFVDNSEELLFDEE